jgi:hypothetical protein
MIARNIRFQAFLNSAAAEGRTTATNQLGLELVFTLGGRVVMVLGFRLVAPDLAVQFVGQLIDCSIQVCVRTFSKQITALDMHIAFSALASFLFFHVVYRQQDFDIHHLVKVSGYSIQLGFYIAAQCGGNFKMVTADRQIHKETPLPNIPELEPG